MNMQLKLDDDGRAVLNESGRPIYVDAVGKESVFDPAELTESVSRLNAELMETRGALTKTNAERAALAEKFDANAVETSFKTSKLVAEKFAVPADLLEAKFGRAFKVENGQVVGYMPDGLKIYSRGTAGQLAGFDEALEILVEGYEARDHILKSSGASGGNAVGGGDFKATVMNRAKFESLPPSAQREWALSGKAIYD
jgi:hypothetical protein